MSQTEPLDQDPVFQLKGSMLAITVLELARNDLELLDRQLAAKVAQAPNFFSNAPLVLALDKLPASEGAVDLPGLMRVCRQHGLRTLAIRASRIEDIAAAIAVDLPVLPPSAPVSVRWTHTKRRGEKTGKTTGADHQTDEGNHFASTWWPTDICPGWRFGGGFVGQPGGGTSRRWEHPCIRPDARSSTRRGQGRLESADFLSANER